MVKASAPAVSVLIPVFNTARYLDAALESVCTQSFTDLEIVAIDDGSTDASGAILAAFAAREPRCRVITRPNRGLIATRNELLATARGEFVAWMDSDDIALPTRIARQHAILLADPALVCVGCDARLIDARGRPLGRESFPAGHDAIVAEQATGAGLRFPTTMVRREVALAVGGFREPFRMGEDLDFLLRVAERGRLANIPEELYLYRQHLASTCAQLGGQWLAYRDTILALAAERRAGKPDRLQRGEPVTMPLAAATSARDQRPLVLAAWSDMTHDQGDRRRAVEYAIRAIGSAPLSRTGWRALRRAVR